MASLGMEGPYELNKVVVYMIVPDNVIGNYALGYLKNDIFIVKYVGRSDSDLQKRIIDHIDEKVQYTHFKFVIQKSIKDAYIKECKNYHEFHGLEGRLDNKVHPDKPKGIEVTCPYCLIDLYYDAVNK